MATTPLSPPRWEVYTSMPKVALRESGRIECEVRIKPFDSSLMENVRFKVDTGADFSTISKSALYKLGYSAQWVAENMKLSETSTSVASGEKLDSYYIRLPVINIFGIEGINYPFGILLDIEEKLPKPSCKGCEFTKAKKMDFRSLLGNDILSCFDISVDRKSNIADFEPQSSLDDRNKKYPDKQLNFIEIASKD